MAVITHDFILTKFIFLIRGVLIIYLAVIGYISLVFAYRYRIGKV